MKKLKYKIRRLKPKTKAYYISATKKRSTSLVAMLQSNHKSTYELETERVNQIVVNRLEGNIINLELKRILMKRNRRLNLELKSAHSLGYMSHVLSEVFLDSKFVITIKDPYSWLKSQLNFYYRFDPPAWKFYREYFWLKRHSKYAPEEALLEETGLCSLDICLQPCLNHYRHVSVLLS